MEARTVEALVQTGVIETTYVRAGAGEPVLLLRTSPTPAELDPLFGQLATQYRVFAPELECSAKAPSFSAWLCDIIQALGLEQPRVILAAANEQELAAMLERMRN